MNSKFPEIKKDSMLFVLCEGKCESAIFNLICKNFETVFPLDSLENDTIIIGQYYQNADKFSKAFLATDTEECDIHIFVIQDSQQLKFNLKGIYEQKVSSVSYFITSPEIEMLMIHALDKYDDFQSEKRKNKKLKPNQFIKINTKYKKPKSENTILEFYEEHSLEDALRKYKSKSQKRDQDNVFFLSDLIIE